IEYSTSTERYYDLLIIKHNSTTKITASGQVSLKTLYVDLSAGDTVKLTYRKDSSVDSYNDTVYFKIESIVSVDGFEPTCTDGVICDICGETAKQPLGHKYQNEVCTVCGASSWEYTVSCDEATITGYLGEKNQITIPTIIGDYKVVGIGTRAFSGSSALTSVTIPDTITTIGNNAFYGCSGLTSVVIPDSVTYLGANVFYNCTGLTSVKLPKRLDEIRSYLFCGCSSLKSVTIPASVTSIAFSAFANCTNLASVNIPNGTTSIANRAFLKCTGLTNVHYCGTADEWANITVGSENTYLTNAVAYNKHDYECIIDKSATCFEDGYTTYECTVCGDVLTENYVEAGHSYESVVTAPTSTAQGYTTHTCSVCGDSFVNSYVDATGTVNGVQNMQITATDTSIIVSWDALSTATLYNLYVKNSKGETIITRALAADKTSVTLSWPDDIEWGENYVIGIRARTSKWLTTVYKDAALTVANRVVDVKAQSVGRTIKVTWKAYEGATAYRVYVYEKGAYPTAFTNVKVTTNSATIINAIYPEVDYEVRVVATVNGT
ncbi:MAG: leucine-rich repeat protein, partial [Clostridia bacterium]|nr:leucine-rich repeat protein [Clostridia bacterium]